MEFFGIVNHVTLLYWTTTSTIQILTEDCTEPLFFPAGAVKVCGVRGHADGVLQKPSASACPRFVSLSAPLQALMWSSHRTDKKITTKTPQRQHQLLRSKAILHTEGFWGFSGTLYLNHKLYLFGPGFVKVVFEASTWKVS